MKIAISTVALLASTVGAFAADLPSRAEAPAPLPPSMAAPIFTLPDVWSGFYVGGALAGRRASGGSSLSEASYALPAHGAVGATNPRASQTGGLTAFGKSNDIMFGGTLFGGYNVLIDNLVYGVEADLSFTDDRSKQRSGSRAIHGAYTDTPDQNVTNDTITAGGTLGVTHNSRMFWDGSLRTRIGVLAAPSLLVFATGGVAIGQVEKVTRTSGGVYYTNDGGAVQASHNFSTTTKTDKIRLGWTIGAGADYKLTDSWTMRAEYRYTNFGKSTGSATSTATCVDGAAGGEGCTQLPVATANVSTRNNDVFHTVRLGLSYQFGADILPTTIFARY